MAGQVLLVILDGIVGEVTKCALPAGPICCAGTSTLAGTENYGVSI